MVQHTMQYRIILQIEATVLPTCEAGIAERVSALDWLSLRYAAIVMNPGLPLSEGTLSYLLHLWTEM